MDKECIIMPKIKLNGEGSIRKRDNGLYEERISAGKIQTMEDINAFPVMHIQKKKR